MDKRAFTPEEREEKTEKKYAGGSLMIALIAVLLIVGGVAAVSFSHFLNEQLFLERQTHLLEITEKMAEITDAVVERAWGNVNTCEQLLLDEEGLERDTVTNCLEDMMGYLDRDDAVIMAFDQKASYYTSDGEMGHWNDSSVLVSSEDDRQTVIDVLPYQNANDTYMIFLQSLENPISLQGSDRQITHIAMAIQTELFKDAFYVSGFGDSGYTFIVNEEGRRIYRDTHLQEFIEGYNILTAMDKYEIVNGGTMEELKAAVGKDDQMCLEFKYNDVNYYVGTALIPSVNWELMLFVPTDVLGANTNELLNRTTQYFFVIGAVLAILLCIVAATIMASRSNRKLVKQEKETNALLAKAAQEAQSANLAKSNFLSHMSHDIRTPINGIMGMTDIAMKNIDDKDRTKECLSKIDTASHHLLSLVNDVLDMSRVESGKTVISHQMMDMRVIIDNCASIIDGQLLERKIKFYKEFEPFAHPILLGDELRLRQVLINILGNAIKFTPDGGEIHFSAKETSEADGKANYRFEITDTGKGMDKAFLEHIFEPFSQEDEQNRGAYSGTGLGMAITKQFVDLMGGSIAVESELCVGSKFIVDLSFDICEETLSAEEKENIKDMSGMKILLVEDNEVNMEIARYLLENEGILVTDATNGKEAIDILEDNEQGSFDAVLMDVMMPVMDGIEATKAIRTAKREDLRNLPIIAMTANAYEEDVKRTREAGMNAHLVKPIDESMLLRILSDYYSASAEQIPEEKEAD